ncbi:MAG: DUF975 family protein [Lachnospiraceae bacterium]
MFTRAELKQQAKEQLKGNLGMLFLCGLVVSLISVGVAFATALIPIPFVSTIASLLVTAPISLGLIKVYLNTTYGEKPQVATIFDGFKQFGPAVILNILIAVFTFLWSLLLFIPGIIKGLSYSMSFYILAENPDMTAKEALNESKAIMDGHKMDLFVLQLSFILWALLGVVTFGIAYIYVIPYMQLTITNFYHRIKNQPVVAAPAEDVVVDTVE